MEGRDEEREGEKEVRNDKGMDGSKVRWRKRGTMSRREGRGRDDEI